MSSVEGVDDGNTGYGILGRSNNHVGAVGESNSGYGVYGVSNNGDAVVGLSNNGVGMRGSSNSRNGVFGLCNSGNGVFGMSDTGAGVSGYSYSGVGLYGTSDWGVGMGGMSYYSNGVSGYSPRAAGVFGQSRTGYGLYGESEVGYGLYVRSRGDTAARIDGNAVTGGLTVAGGARIVWDLRVNGNLTVDGTLQKGGGSFKIDHPLDPANRYLSHSFVESPDMKNVYDGVVVSDNNGEAEIDLPEWFSALNEHFRYQLTAIGAPGPNLYIAEEISEGSSTNYNDSRNNNGNSHFKIAGGTSGMKVSWQVTGIRKDPWANANRIQVEQDKPAEERGYYTYPDLYGQPEEKGINRLLFPEEEKWQEQLVFENKQPRGFK